MFGDFGEMVEYDITGGILELYSEKRGAPAFCVDRLILYTHPMARQGHLVQIAGTDYQVTDDLHALRLAVHLNPPISHTVGRALYWA
jgi:hypothetical protein